MTAMHPARPSSVGLRLYGRRVVLRPLVPQDFNAWSEVRRRNGEWLTSWEPLRLPHHPDPETTLPSSSLGPVFPPLRGILHQGRLRRS